MPVIRLDSMDDPRLADYRVVRDPDLARDRNLFIAEGRLVVERLVQSHRFTVRSFLLTDSAYVALQPTLVRQSDDAPIFLCRSVDFLGLTGLNIHRGCLALVERPPAATVDAVLRDASTVAVLESVSNPDNVGGIFRNAAAFGVDAILLSPSSGDPWYRKAIRTSMAASLRVPFAWLTPWPDGLAVLRAAGFELAALTPREPSATLDSYFATRSPHRLALMLGAEGSGLSPEAEAMADARVRIPIVADVDSLNVAVAAGIALSHLYCRSRKR